MTPQEEHAEYLKLAEQLPVEAVRQMEKVLKDYYEKYEVPWNDGTLQASLIMANIISAGLPPVYAQFTTTSILLLHRLVEEARTGLVASPIKPPQA